MREKIIPKLILQPLVENAYKHGLSKKIDANQLKISGSIQNNYLVFTVADNGAGMSPEKLAQVGETNPNGIYNIGLKNINQRAKLYGDESCGLQIDSQLQLGTSIKLRLKDMGSKQEEAKHD